MFNEAISAIINLLKLRKDVKKTDLEIEKLEREKKTEQSTIQIANTDEIKTYDPKVNQLFKTIERDRLSNPEYGPSDPYMQNSTTIKSNFKTALIFIVIAFLIFYYFG